MSDNDIWNPENLDLPQRDCAELAGLLALTACERKPPAVLKERVLARARGATPRFAPAASVPAVTPIPSRSSSRRLISMAFAGLALVLAAAVGLWPHVPNATLAHVSGTVSIDGQPARAGERLKPGQRIMVADGSEAVLLIGERVAARLLHGGEAVLSDRSDIQLELRKGWLLSAVVSGTPYSVVTEHGRISALGTDFMTRTQVSETFFCICHGRLKIAGPFGETRVESTNHGGKIFTGSLAPHEPRQGTMDGHMPSDIESLRAFLKRK